MCKIEGTREVRGVRKQKEIGRNNDYFTNLLNAISLQLQEAQLCTNRVNTPKNLHQCMPNQIAETAMKRKKCTYLGKYDSLYTQEQEIHKSMYLSQRMIVE